MVTSNRKRAERPNYGRAMFIFINVLVWVIILCFPFLIATHDGGLVRLEKYVIYSWIPLMFMLVFYFNYYYLIDKLIFEKRLWWLFLLCNGVMIMIVASCSHILQEFYLTQIVPDADEPHEKIALATYIIRDGLVLMLVVGLSVALKMVMAWQQQERERARLEAEKRDAELANLRSQLNPHFLFNSLNNIYGLTLSDSGKAREAIHALSTILRYILYTGENVVPLDKELDFIRGYIDLARLRTAGDMSIEVSLPDTASGIHIAPLVFMTLIENGFKHGISPDQPSFVRIAIGVEEGDAGEDRHGRRGKGRGVVTCTVENSDFPKTDADRSGSGIGVGNLRRRLALLYPDSHTLTFGRNNGIHTASLKIVL